uniref:Uncharacterized protein n=1 Tax=Rhizophora mucronata TaxID=61149 RepID=A0A2P2Q1Y3_RHIMU
MIESPLCQVRTLRLCASEFHIFGQSNMSKQLKGGREREGGCL